MILNVFTDFIKRRNSTKQPTGTGTEYSVYLKEDCSVENPVFLIDGINLNANYCLWNDHYYFIDDIIVTTNNIYELHCSMDVLATFKSEISEYSGYIERASDEYDPYIYDGFICAKKETGDISQAITTITFFDSTGSYIFPVMNKYGIEIFVTQHLEEFGHIFMPGTYGLNDFDDWLKAGISTLTDLGQFFGKVMWVPFTPTQLQATLVPASEPISVGTIAWLFDNDIYKMQPLTMVTSLGVYRINRPAPLYNDFRDTSSEWVEYSLYIPGIGNVPLDATIAGDRSVDIVPYLYYEPENGELVVRLDAVKDYGTINESHTRLGVYKSNMCATIPFGDSQWALKESGYTLSNGLNSVVTSIMQGNYVGAVLSGVSGVVNAAGTALTGAHANVTNGGGLALSKYMHDFVFTQIPLASADIPNTECGRPLCKIDQIGQHSGFIKMGQANVPIAGLGGEKELLNNYLNNGFYYE